MDGVPPDGTVNGLRWLEAQTEQAYSAMYGGSTRSELAARYSDAKEFLHDAIGLARRLAEIKTVFRRQFPA